MLGYLIFTKKNHLAVSLALTSMLDGFGPFFSSFFNLPVEVILLIQLTAQETHPFSPPLACLFCCGFCRWFGPQSQSLLATLLWQPGNTHRHQWSSVRVRVFECEGDREEQNVVRGSPDRPLPQQQQRLIFTFGFSAVFPLNSSPSM